MHNKMKSIIPLLLLLLLATAACNKVQQGDATASKKINTLNPEAPGETESLGQLTGSWDAEQSIIDSTGSFDSRKSRAIWKFYYILDGHAIQDDWISIDSLDNKHAAGTNIRIYNTRDSLWHMAWIDKTHRRLATFTATNEDGTVVMDGTNADGRHIRNTFYNISAQAFDWKQEWTFDEGQTWMVVAKIHCTRKK